MSAHTDLLRATADLIEKYDLFDIPSLSINEVDIHPETRAGFNAWVRALSGEIKDHGLNWVEFENTVLPVPLVTIYRPKEEQ